MIPNWQDIYKPFLFIGVQGKYVVRIKEVDNNYFEEFQSYLTKA